MNYSNINFLVDYIKQHPDGFTVSPYTHNIPENGYAVAPIKDAEIKVKYSQIDNKILNDFIRNLEIISSLSKKQVYAGGWLNSEDNNYYLDVVYVIKDKNKALYIAKAADQIAVYNLENNQ